MSTPSLTASEKAILRARAQALAAPPRAIEQDGLAAIAFTLGGARYALETHFLRSAVQLRFWRRLHHTPAHLPGIANVQGQIIGLTDLRPLLRLPVSEDPNPLVLLLAGPVWQTALLIETLLGPIRLHLPETKLSDNSERLFIKATCNGDVHLLDAKKILADPRFVLNQLPE